MSRNARLKLGVWAVMGLVLLWLFVADEPGVGRWDVPGALTTFALLLAVAGPGVRHALARERIRLPDAVGGRALQSDPRLRVRMAITLLLVGAVPVGIVAFVALGPIRAGWLLADALIVIVLIGTAIGEDARRRTARPLPPPPALTGALQRLALLADVAAPAAWLQESEAATAWTEDDAIHVTSELLDRLSVAELEAVLAHELVHIARGDALVMDLVTGPSRRLSAGLLAILSMDGDVRIGSRSTMTVWAFAVMAAAPGGLVAGTNTLLAAALSRGRELSADAGAAVLTGSPAALAAALIEIDTNGTWKPTGDLRSRGAQSIIGLRRPAIRWLRTHPPLVQRVQRLQAMEARLQA